MGTVWLAQQTEPVKRAFAVKLIKAGMDTRQVLARFEAERQALALMDHPNIAKVLDAGATPDGRPYFVMELVKGVPITKFCDERRLTPRERLELFVPVCQAIQHAHQKGVIHRDIKPTNVLVALYDGRPVPKVIDFGVAKAAGQPLTEQTLCTGFGAVVGTPGVHVARSRPSSTTWTSTPGPTCTRLGVLLYELLTGTTPLDRKRLGEAALLEVLRLIREEEPPRPSTRLSTTDALPSHRGQPRDRAGEADAAGAGRAGLDRDEGPGEGPQPAVRDGQRLRGGRAAVPGRRAGAGVPAVGLVSAAKSPESKQAAGPGRGVGGLRPDSRGDRHDVGDAAGREGGMEYVRRPHSGRAGTGRGPRGPRKETFDTLFDLTDAAVHDLMMMTWKVMPENRRFPGTDHRPDRTADRGHARFRGRPGPAGTRPASGGRVRVFLGDNAHASEALQKAVQLYRELHARSPNGGVGPASTWSIASPISTRLTPGPGTRPKHRSEERLWPSPRPPTVDSQSTTASP